MIKVSQLLLIIKSNAILDHIASWRVPFSSNLNTFCTCSDASKDAILIHILWFASSSWSEQSDALRHYAVFALTSVATVLHWDALKAPFLFFPAFKFKILLVVNVKNVFFLFLKFLPTLKAWKFVWNRTDNVDCNNIKFLYVSSR